jgi:hypothetical protein
MKTTTPIPGQTCSKCGYKSNAATYFGDRKPKPGNVSMCLNCGHVTIFDENLRFREPTLEEKVALARHQRLLDMQFARAATYKQKTRRKKCSKT